jgi:hypothetical protein
MPGSVHRCHAGTKHGQQRHVLHEERIRCEQSPGSSEASRGAALTPSGRRPGSDAAACNAAHRRPDQNGRHCHLGSNLLYIRDIVSQPRRREPLPTFAAFAAFVTAIRSMALSSVGILLSFYLDPNSFSTIRSHRLPLSSYWKISRL